MNEKKVLVLYYIHHPTLNGTENSKQSYKVNKHKLLMLPKMPKAIPWYNIYLVSHTP